MATRFSANLGFLWADLPLPQAISKAAEAGFNAVECHWPYDQPAKNVAKALRDTGLPMLGLNTRKGDSFGLSAMPGQEAVAKHAITEAIDYARKTGCTAIHVMAGIAKGPEAEACFQRALEFACTKAGGLTILIEPINQYDAPGYFLRDTAHAVQIIETLGRDNLKLMFDCYHVARTEGDVSSRLRSVFPHIGHIQFAGVPDRAEPDAGELDYKALFAKIKALGWTRPLGAEYRPRTTVEDGLGWMQALL